MVSKHTLTFVGAGKGRLAAHWPFYGVYTVLMEEYEKLKRLVEQAYDDVAKAQGGNKAAGTRVRKMMQDIKSAAQEVRKKVLEVRSDS